MGQLLPIVNEDLSVMEEDAEINDLQLNYYYRDTLLAVSVSHRQSDMTCHNTDTCDYIEFELCHFLKLLFRV
jgi:hypothetical protein